MNISTITNYMKNRYNFTDFESAKWLNNKTLSMLCKNNVISFSDYFKLSYFNTSIYYKFRIKKGVY